MSSKVALVDMAGEWLETALSGVDGDVLLTSPYLSYDVCQRIAVAARSSPRSWMLATTLDASAVANGFLSVQGLADMLDAGVEIRDVARLHAKCSIVGSKAMLGSANLTGSGLGTSAKPNRELGIELYPDQAEAARKVIRGWPDELVDQRALDELLEKSKHLTRNPRDQSGEMDAESALALVEGLLVDARDPQRSLWLKLEYGEPALDGWRERSWFASPKKGKPGFREGDLVFICAKTTHDCYAVVEVVSDPESKPGDYVACTSAYEVERWPWINRTTPRFVPPSLMDLKLSELGVKGQGLQNGHVHLEFDQFTAGVRALARLATD